MADIRINIQLEGGQFKGEAAQIQSAVTGLQGKIETSFESMAARVTAFSFAVNQIADFANRAASALSVPIQKFIDFEASISNVATLGVPNVQALGEEVLRLSTEIGQPIENISNGLYEVVSAGVDATNQIMVLEASAQAAKAGLAETTDALNLGAAVIKGYGKEWSDFTAIMDLAFTTVNLGQTTFDQLAANIGEVIPLFAALDISVNELFGSFATLTGVTGNTSMVATQLKAVATELARPTQELVELIQAQGFASVEAAVKTQGLAGILAIVGEATEGSAARMNEYFSSVEAVNALLALTTSQFETFREKTDAMAGSAGAMTEAFGIANDTIESQLQILRNQFDAAMIRAVEVIRPVISGVLDIASAILSMNWEALIIGATTAATALAGLSLGTLIAGFGGLIPALNAAAVAFQAFAVSATTAISSIPLVGWVAAGVTALTSLGVLLAATAESEAELAAKRKEVAERTMDLVEAEIRRTEQAIETQGATEQLTDRLGKLNEQMIIQQKIIADANIRILTEQFEEAEKSAEEFASKTFAGVSYLRPLIKQLGDDFVSMETQVIFKLGEISDKLYENQLGLINLSERESERLQKEQEDLGETLAVIQKAAEAQRQLNAELQTREGLQNLTINTEIDTEPVRTALQTLTQNPPTVPVRILPEIPSEEIEFPELPQDLEALDIFEFEEQLREKEELLQLHFENNLISEEEYHIQRQALLADSARVVEENLGREHKAHLEINARILANERQYQAARLQLEQQAVRNIGTILETLASTVGQTNFVTFRMIQALQIAQAIGDTYAAANRALATLPPPFGAIAAAAAVAQGLANVARIASTRIESRAEGGPVDRDRARILQKGDFGDGENRLVVMNDEEYIIRAQQTRRNYAVLEALNNSDEEYILAGQTIMAKSLLSQLKRQEGGLAGNLGQIQLYTQNLGRELRLETKETVIQPAFDPAELRAAVKDAIIQGFNESTLQVTGESRLEDDTIYQAWKSANQRAQVNRIE